MLGPDRAYFLVGSKFATRCGSFRFLDGDTFFGCERHRGYSTGTGKLDDGACNIVLLVRGQPTSGLYGLFEQFGHLRRT